MHKQYMDLAIQEAKKETYTTYKNPRVGAVLVKNDKIIATGAHLAYGQPHAERHVLTQCESPEDVHNSTLYVTLEPCHHFGKQPPCTQAVVESGITRVVIGQLDPNPLVSGQGKAYLESCGIEVIVGIQEQEVRALNRAYLTFYEQNRPYVVLKQAITLDGKISIVHNQRTNITSVDAIAQVRKERAYYQAILVGSQTVLADNPSLLTTESTKFPPLRIVLDRTGRLFSNLTYAIFQETNVPVWIFTKYASIPKLPKHVQVYQLTTDDSITEVLMYLKREGVQSVYVEGGAHIHNAFLQADYVDEVITYLSPTLIGGNSVSSFFDHTTVPTMKKLSLHHIELVGEDLKIVARRDRPCLQA